MRLTILPGALRGRLSAVPSKSAAHRHLICAALSDGETILRIDATNQDIDATADCLAALGAKIVSSPGAMTVTPIPRGEKRAEATLDCGESGSTLRFLLPLAAALGTPSRFLGGGRLPDRPNRALTDQMRAHGAAVESDAPPMTVGGQLKPGIYSLPGDISSQYASGLLMALPLLFAPSEIRFTTPVESIGYIRMTIAALAEYGVTVQETEQGFSIPAPQPFQGGDEKRIEGDWSAAAFWQAANALGSHIEMDALDPQSAQGDKAIVDILKQFDAARGADVVIDASDVPDLVPILAVRAALYSGKTRIEKAARLRLKECDRLNAMAENLSNLGADIRETEDGLIISGGRKLRGGRVRGFNDHRIAMAMAIAATVAEAPVTLCDAQAVAKSYPAFWDDFQRLGGNIDGK